MNFSYEELYHMYGQYDTLITIAFQHNSESYEIFGSTIMGSLIYTENERNELEEILKHQPIPRSDRKVRVMPSPVVVLTQKQFEQAERYGVLCSDIYEIMSYNKPRENSFKIKEKKEIQNTITININPNRLGLNQQIFGFLTSRLKKNEPLAPEEKNKFLGLARYFGHDITIDPYTSIPHNEHSVRYHELYAKFTDLTIAGEDIKELTELTHNRFEDREKLINSEIERSGGKIEEVAKRHGSELSSLKNAAHRFDEQIILFGEKLVYLDLERFLHIYARHVTETHIGGHFEAKTVFQYKYDDILRIIKAVAEAENTNIEDHFKSNPDKNFVRRGKRSSYYHGHYYRIEIEPSGRLVTFHPYNNNEERDADIE